MMEVTKELTERIKANADKVRTNIAEACREAGRDPSEVTLIGVSKVFPVEYAAAAVMGGLNDLGENRVQELVPKIDTEVRRSATGQALIAPALRPT